MSETSCIPAAVSQLAALFASALAPLPVFDGPVYDPPANFLAVGFNRTDDPAVQATATVSGPRREVEEVTVSNLLSYGGGVDDVPTMRAALFDAFAVCKQTVAANPQLGGTVTLARVTDYEYTPQLVADNNVVVDLRFTVTVQAPLV